MVRLIRSKGVGIYFVTQNPIDIPDAVAGQLGNRVQHALRAFTPKEARAIRAAAETFRANPGVDVAQAITDRATSRMPRPSTHPPPRSERVEAQSSSARVYPRRR